MKKALLHQLLMISMNTFDDNDDNGRSADEMKWNEME